MSKKGKFMFGFIILAVALAIPAVANATTYDFTNTTLLHKAYEGHTLSAFPPSLASANETELSPSEYDDISASDDDRAWYGYVGETENYDYHKFEFKIGEPVSGITQIDVLHEGYGGETLGAPGHSLYIWNYSNPGWEYVNSTSVESPDQILTGTFASGFSDYIQDGSLYLLAITNSESSCPLLYTWDGTSYQFIADINGGGGFGFSAASKGYDLKRPKSTDYIKIDGSQLMPVNGSYRLEIAEDQDEIAYLDAARLIAVDHSPAVEIYSPIPDWYYEIPPFEIHTIMNPATPVSAIDGNGRDILPVISEVDRDCTEAQQFRFDTVTVDLGDLRGAQQIKLLYNAWVDWASGPEYAARYEYVSSHPGVQVEYMPYVEVINEDGEWEQVSDEEHWGIAQAKPRTMVLDITDWFRTNDYRMRINNWYKTHIDYIAVDTSEDEEVLATELAPVSADLYWKGVSIQTSPDGKEPTIADYYDIGDITGFSVYDGKFTRYGDVLPLLTEVDDKFAIIHVGDSVSINFDELPIPEGMERDYYLISDAYYKQIFVRELLGQDVNSVEPLPFQAMSNYPYPDDESYPYDAEHTAYLEEYNTREFRESSHESEHNSIVTDYVKVEITTACDIVNSSFETGDYTGWTLYEFNKEDPDGPHNPDCGTWGIAEDGLTIYYGNITYDFYDEVMVEQTSEGLPITYYATDGNYLAYQLQYCAETHGMYQDITLSPCATTLYWDMWYDSHHNYFSENQSLAISIKDPTTNSTLETLFETTQGVDPYSINMTTFSANISAYAGQTVRLDVEMDVYDFWFDAAFDNFRIRSSMDQSNDGNYNWYSIHGFRPTGQEFVPSVSTLEGVEVYIRGSNSYDGYAEMTVNIHSGNITEPIIASKTQVLHETKPDHSTGDWVYFKFDSPVDVSIGNTYVLELSSNTTAHMWFSSDNDTYADGSAIRGGVIQPNTDYAFRTTYGCTCVCSSGPNSGTGSHQNAGIGLYPWQNPENIAASDNIDAEVTLPDGSASHYLRASNFGFNINSSVLITGIEVNVERSANSTVGGGITDYVVSLVDETGAKLTGPGTNLAKTGDSWTTSDNNITYGGPSELWGGTWNYSDINDPDFGVVIQVRNLGPSGNPEIRAEVDYITITVYHTCPISDDYSPVISYSPSSPTVQYSDGITVNITATDDDSPGSLLSASGTGLPESLSLVPLAHNDGGVPGSANWTITGITDVAAGDYDVTINVTDGANLTSTNITITVTEEDATVTFPEGTDANPVAVEVASEGGNSGEIKLTAIIKESRNGVEPNGEPDAYSGNICLAEATAQLVPVGPGAPVDPIPSSSVVCDGPDSYAKQKKITWTFDDVPVNTYIFEVTVTGGYYTGSSGDVLAVYDPSLGFTTGGGWFYWPGTDDKTNFGYTMKYNKKATRVQGSLLLIRHNDDGSINRIKSNAIHSLALGEVHNLEDFGWASFSGKCTFMWPVDGGQANAGNNEFLVYVEDHSEPGVGEDKFWFTITDWHGDVPLTEQDFTLDDNPENASVDSSEKQTINGGNIVVPQSSDKGKGHRKK